MGVNGSASSQRARAYATGLARRQRAQLVAVYVHSDWRTMLMPETAAVSVQAHQQLAHELHDDTLAAAQHFDQPIAFHLRTGDVATQLKQAAVELRASALVIGAGRRRCWFTRSCTGRLLRMRPCPVIVVP